jgi:hypothetical protein
MIPRVERFISLLRSKYQINIAYKHSSSFMKFLSRILFFIPDFQTRFTTTIGNTIYFPSEDRLKDESSLDLIAHEVRHIHDSQLDKFYNIKYLFPQILFLLFFALCFISLLFLIPAFLCLAPLPAYWRMKIELNGYITTLFVNNLLLEERNFSLEKRLNKLLEMSERIHKAFTGSSYYFMWVFGVEPELTKAVYEILEGSLEKKDPFYKFIKESFDSSKSI